MANERFTTALEVSQEVELTVTGRKSGREITDKVWFVHAGDRLYLLPVNGTDSGWFKNVRDNRAVRLAAEGTQITARAKPITDPAVVGQVVAMFRARYGSENVDRYYPKRNAAVEVPLD
jgi:deazaflavin-dependent oxidoreductase (nitroreductase family)